MGIVDLSRFKNKHFIVFSGNSLMSVLGFLFSYLLFHFLSVNDAGIWFFVQSIVALCEASRYGFLATATVKFYAGTEKARSETVLGSVWYLALLLTAFILLLNAGALFFLPFTANREAILCIKWVGITYLSSLPADVIFWRLQAEERYSAMTWYRILNTSSTIIAFGILILMHRMTLENAFLFNLITNAFSSLAGVLMNMAGFRTIFRRTKECVREIAAYGKFTLGTTSFSVLLGNADTLIINFVLGPVAVAVYNLAMRLMPFIEMPLRTFITTGMSEMAISFNRNDLHQVTYIFRKYSGMLTIAFIPVTIGALLLADPALHFLGGAGYRHSVAPDLYRIFMIVALLYPLDRFNGLALDIIHQTKYNFYKVVIMLAVKVVANYALLVLMGNLFGIGISLFLVTLSALIYGNYQLRKSLEFNIFEIIKLGYTEMRDFLLKNLLKKATGK